MFLERPLMVWALLAGGAVLAAFAARKGGRGAVIGVFCAVWAILYSLSVIPELQLSQHNWVGRILGEFWKTPTILVAASMTPWLWLTGKASVLKAAIWGIGAATIMMCAFPVIAIIASLATPDNHRPCRLPSLESPVPSRITIGIGTEGYFSDTCLVPVARELEFDREYGTIYMQWWDARADHRLRISGQTPDGEPLGIGVNRVDPTGLSEYSPEPREQRVVTFSRNNSISLRRIRRIRTRRRRSRLRFFARMVNRSRKSRFIISPGRARASSMTPFEFLASQFEQSMTRIGLGVERL